MSAASLLIEIGCEDLPARFQAPLATALQESITQGLDSEGVSRGSSQLFVTPRRVAVLIQNVAAQQPEQQVRRQGPALSVALRDGQPTPAGLGFAKSCGVDFAALGRESTGKGEYLVFQSTTPGQALGDLLPGLFADSLRQMDRLAPKRMRWGDGEATFVRPVQWLCALHGDRVLTLKAFGLTASNLTFGHRFHHPGAIALHQANDYPTALQNAMVMADPAARREEIRRQVTQAGQACGGDARISDDLLDEVTALVEWPVTVHGQFETRFLAVPPEAITLTIEENQRYFPVFDSRGELLPHFVTVANIASRDPVQVVAGNERVVRPRLEDALFFWDQDRKIPLEDRLADLERVNWARGLGTLRDKALRLESLCRALAPAMRAEAEAAARAGRLAKCDLVTRMVFEMTDLQGIMGGHYLRQQDSHAGAVADAIAAQYRPAGPGESVPDTALGQVVALADKLDTLRGYFSIDQAPTASKDPFGLRRAALGLLRILVEGEHALDWPDLLEAADSPLSPPQHDQLLAFLRDRLRGLLVDRGLPAQVVAAVLDGATGPLDARDRAEAVAAFAATAAGDALAASSKRIRNILAGADELRPTVDPQGFVEPAESALWTALNGLPDHDAGYADTLAALATLQAPVDAFFDTVMVNADDAGLRRNRLALLAKFDSACSSIADFAVLASGSR